MEQKPPVKKRNLVLPDCDARRAEMLVAEIGKVRCWLTGWHNGRSVPGQITLEGPPGEDALRQVQVILKDAISKATGG